MMKNKDLIKQNNAAFIDRIIEKREIRRDEIRNKRLRVGLLRNISYLFQVLSVLIASYAVFHYTSDYSGFHVVVIWAAAILILILVEIAKRFSALNTAQGVYNSEDAGKKNWVVLLGVAVLISMVVSYHGGDKFIMEENKGPELVHNAAIDSLSNLIAEQDKTIATLSTSKWKGALTRAARDGINDANKIKAALIQEQMRLSQRDEKQNDGIELTHEAKFSRFGAIFGGIAALLDILLIAFLFWAEKDETDVERYVLNRKKRPVQGQSAHHPQAPALKAVNNQIELDRVTAQIIAQGQQISELTKTVSEVVTRTPSPAPARTHARTHARVHARTRTHAHARNAPARNAPAHTCKECGKGHTGPKGSGGNGYS